MITFTRRLALQMRVVFRKALGVTRANGPAVCFTTGPDGIHVRARTGDAAVEYHQPGDCPPEQILAPFELLADVEARRDDPVELEAPTEGRISVRWRDGSVPQMAQYDAPATPKAHDFPAAETFAENPPGLLRALHDAVQTTDPAPIRFATDHVQLRSASGQIEATDGRQILVQSGFEFPWDDDLLIPRTMFFGCRELPEEEPVLVGRNEKWVMVRIGPWTIFLWINDEGRFPDVRSHMPSTDAAIARFQVTPADAEFLSKNLPKLPGDDAYNLPVTMDLNGHVAVRGKAADQDLPTELILTGTTLSGEPVRVNTNRRFLGRAMALGFRDVYVTNPKTPVLCCDDRRQYAWAILEPKSAVAPSPDAIRIESQQSEAEVQRPQTRTRKRKVPMSESKPNENGRAKSTRRRRTSVGGKPGHDVVTTLIEQAEAVKASLRESLAKTSELIASLKRHRKQSKAVRIALATLHELQPAGDR